MPWRTRYDLWHRGGRNSYLQIPGYSLTIFGRYERCTWTDGYVPQAIVAFLESTDYENAIRLAISIGGDSDTLA
jgi:ADP-ribosylglycohydrolase